LPIRFRVGLIASLSRPGGNLTGLTFISTEVAPKSLELLREIAPQTRKVGYLGDGSNEGGASVFEQLQKYARSLKVTVQFFDGRLRADLERSFATLVREEFDGLIVGNSASSGNTVTRSCSLPPSRSSQRSTRGASTSRRAGWCPMERS
jgi:putative ABC transport system substrate-binding protein